MSRLFQARGCQRHNYFQDKYGRCIKSVGDLRKVNYYIKSFTDTLDHLTCHMDAGLKIDVYAEVPLVGPRNKNRRADLILYIPENMLILIEFKTTECESLLQKETRIRTFKTQVMDTLENLKIMSYREQTREEYNSKKTIRVYALLVTKFYGTIKNFVGTTDVLADLTLPIASYGKLFMRNILFERSRLSELRRHTIR